MSTLLPLVLNGFRESRRNRITVVVFLFAFISVFSATFALELTVATFERVMTDIGLGLMSLIAVFLAIFLGGGLIPREIERRTIYLVVSRPVSRSAFVIGRLLGNVMTVWFVTLVMAALFIAQVKAEGAPVTSAHLTAIVGLLFEVLLVSAVSFLFAANSSQVVATVSTVGLYFIGHMAGDLYRIASRSTTEAVRLIGTALYYVLPNLDRLDFRARATYGDPTSLTELLSSVGYSIGYAAVVIAVACLLFERRDFK